MAARYMYPTPPLGAIGVYSLLSPFSTQEGESFECIAVRRFSDYEVNSEDLWTDLYSPAGLTEDKYLEDKKLNLEIVTLMSERGYTLQVPVKYIQKYPLQDGVPYRRMGLHVSLPAMLLDQDLSAFKTRIEEAALDTLGVSVKFKEVETSRVRRFNPDESAVIQVQRQNTIGSNVTPYVKMRILQNQLQEATQKIQALEAYILANQTP